MRILREPLVHFLLLGAGIYALHALLAPPSAEQVDRTIRVSAGEIAWLEDAWEQRWRRPPTERERQRLIQDYVRETALYREALALGLDAGDVIVRRRLAQKLEFLTQDLAVAEPPSESELRSFFAERAESYRDPVRVTLTQLFFDPERRGERARSDAEAARAVLASQADPLAGAGERGDRTLLEGHQAGRSQAELAQLFGEGFAGSVFALEPGRWHGPIESGYGAHLVFVHERVEPPAPRYADVAERVRGDWEAQRRERVNEQYVEGLLEKYTVVIEEGP